MAGANSSFAKVVDLADGYRKSQEENKELREEKKLRRKLEVLEGRLKRMRRAIATQKPVQIKKKIDFENTQMSEDVTQAQAEDESQSLFCEYLNEARNNML